MQLGRRQTFVSRDVSYVWRDSFTCVTWLIDVCDMSHSYVRYVSFIRVTWHIHMCGVTRSYVRHDSFMCVTWFIRMCDMTHSCVTWLIHMWPKLYAATATFESQNHTGSPAKRSKRWRGWVGGSRWKNRRELMSHSWQLYWRLMCLFLTTCER